MENEIINGETPNGEVKAEIFYMNDDVDVVEKNNVTRAVIRELDKGGNLIHETWDKEK